MFGLTFSQRWKCCNAIIMAKLAIGYHNRLGSGQRNALVLVVRCGFLWVVIFYFIGVQLLEHNPLLSWLQQIWLVAILSRAVSQLGCWPLDNFDVTIENLRLPVFPARFLQGFQHTATRSVTAFPQISMSPHQSLWFQLWVMPHKQIRNQLDRHCW